MSCCEHGNEHSGFISYGDNFFVNEELRFL